MKLYSYVVRCDNGAAPNPFWNYCTLAICKPKIRRSAQKGDWIIGTGSKENVGTQKLIYAMKVDEVLTFEDYFKDRRFEDKIPVGKEDIRSKGDNIYYKNENGEYEQKSPSVHSFEDLDKREEAIERDTKNGKYVLISGPGHFYYFGRKAKPIPKKYSWIIKKGPGHKSKFSEDKINVFLKWIQKNCKSGLHGYPCRYVERSMERENCGCE
jgi:hypothetical protein